VEYSRSSRNRLSSRDLHRFEGDTLFDRVARAVCHADCLPRKELFEAWEVARRVRRRFRGGRVVDLACGHGLLGHLMLLLDDSSPSVMCVDVRLPESAATLTTALASEWPRLAGRVSFTAADLAGVVLEPTDVVVSAHACGALTDAILARAIDARARVAVLPCCHDAGTCDAGHLEGWVDVALAIDVTRAARLIAAGYRVRTQTIPATITAKNRLLLGEPASAAR
jgi:hypothetical protein